MLARALSATVATVLLYGALLTGCGSASDGASQTGSSSVKADGAAIFTNEGCASCHTLAAVGAKGVTGPNLDELKPSADAAADQIISGGGGMPEYDGRLKPNEIQAVADFIAANAGR